MSQHCVGRAWNTGTPNSASSNADDLLDAKRAHGVDIAGARGENRGLVGLLPFADQFLLVGVAEHHEGRAPDGLITSTPMRRASFRYRGSCIVAAKACCSA